MAFPPVIPEKTVQSEDRIMRSLLLLGMEGAERLPFSRRPYTTMMDDTNIIVSDMVADAEAHWNAGAIARSKLGQLPSARPLSQQSSPLVSPEQSSGRLLNTAS